MAARVVISNLQEILVVDLETTCWEPKESRPSGARAEIIEIGYCLLDIRTGSPRCNGSIYVEPETSTVSPFCEQLTGITAAQLVLCAYPYIEAVACLRREFPKLRDMAWASWGDFDREMFEAAARAHLHELPADQREDTIDRRKAETFQGLPAAVYPFGRTHLNIRHLFALLTGADAAVDLPTAAFLSGVELTGRLHSGKSDARNEAAVLAALLKRP